MSALRTLTLAAAMGAALPLANANAANTLTINYYTISSSDPDANNLAGGVFSNEVQSALGPDGLPVLNIPRYGCTTNCYAQNGAPGFPNGATTPNVNVNSSGEITYWSTSNPYITNTLTTTTTLPFNQPSNFFPPNGTGSNDGGTNGYQAVELSGTITAPTTETLNFSIGSDDMSFAYIDGMVVCDDGGVHASASTSCTTPTISAGTHTFDLFFADINVSQSGLTFSIATTGVTTGNGGGSTPTPPTPPTSTPEPASLALLGTALGLLGLRRRV